MKKLLLFILILSATVQAADTELQDLAELVAIASADVLYVVDDPEGAPASRKITALNLFDMIDTSAELIAILTNETGTGSLVFATSPTLVTPILGTITSGVGTSLTALNGENIQNDTIDDDSIDFADITGVDFTLTDCGAITSTGTITATVGFDIVGAADIDYGSANVTDHTFVTDGTGTAEIVLPAGSIDGTEILDDTVDSGDYAADSIDNEHINWADIDNLGDEGAVTLAATVTVSDDEATDDNQEIVFTTDNATLESDGDLHYNPNSGTVTATEFVGGGGGLTGTLTAYDDIADPDAASSITFADGETVTWATAEDSAGSFFLIQNSDADLAANTYLLDLDYSVDDNQANADYFRCQDAGGVVFSIQQDGDTATTGNVLADGNLSVGNATTTAGVLTLLEDDDDGANFASFMVPALAANTVYTLPPDDGDNTEILQTNGAGVLTWVANAGGMTSFIAEDGDGTEVSISDAEEWKFVEGTGIDIDWTDTSTGSDADPFDLTFTVALGTDIVAAEMGDSDHGDVAWSGNAASVEGFTMYNAATSTYYVVMSDTDGAGANSTPYTDTECTYTEASGTLAATEFSGGGSNLTSVDAITGDSATAFFDAGTIEHEWGGLQADISGYTGLIAITGADTTAEIDSLDELEGQLADVTLIYTEAIIPAAGTDPDVDATGEFSIDTDGANEPNDVVLRTIDGNGTQVALAQEQKSFQATIIKPNDLADATRDACPIWSNETGMSFVVTKIEAWADTDDTAFNVEVVDADGTSNNATVDAVNCTTGTGPYTATETTIDAATITANRMIFIDFDDTDDPGWVKISICGYFLSDVN